MIPKHGISMKLRSVFLLLDLLRKQTIPILERLWARQFSLSEEQLVQRQQALTKLAEQIERFFGPQAQPQVRIQS
jgi:hypothetical protein